MVKKLGTVAWAILLLAIAMTILLSTIAQYIGVIFQLVGTLGLLVALIAGTTAAVKWFIDRKKNEL